MRTDNWYVLHVRTGQEMCVAEAVRNLPGAAALVPSVILTERRDGKREECSRLLYPGYVFAQTERLNAQRYYDFKRIDGVLRLLGLDDGDIPRCVPESEMQTVMDITGDTQTIGISHGIKDASGKIKIVDGPLKSLQGRITKIDTRQQRATVRLSLMGHAQIVSVALITSSPTEPEAE